MLLPLALALLASQDKPRFEDEILAFEAADRKARPSPGRVLFVGSSSIRLWGTLEKDMAGVPVLNRGFGGSWLADSVRLVDRIVLPYRPRAIVVFAGTNDLQDGKSPEAVAESYREFVRLARAGLPNVPIAYIAISPAPSRWNLKDKMWRTNALIRAFSADTPGLRFIDTWPLMLDANGEPRPELYVGDRLHLNAEGYRLWTGAIRPVVLRMVAPARR